MVASEGSMLEIRTSAKTKSIRRILVELLIACSPIQVANLIMPNRLIISSNFQQELAQYAIRRPLSEHFQFWILVRIANRALPGGQCLFCIGLWNSLEAENCNNCCWFNNVEQCAYCHLHCKFYKQWKNQAVGFPINEFQIEFG